MKGGVKFHGTLCIVPRWMAKKLNNGAQPGQSLKLEEDGSILTSENRSGNRTQYVVSRRPSREWRFSTEVRIAKNETENNTPKR